MFAASRAHQSLPSQRPAGRIGTSAFAPSRLSAQRAFGNRAIARSSRGPSDSSGFDPTASDDQDVGAGRTAGEAVGDIGRPVGSFLGNVFGSIVEAVAGNSISSATTSAPVWNPHGHFHWEVGFSTSGRNGWLIQKVESTRRAQDSSGTALPDSLTPLYWEAWSVDGSGSISPAAGATHDFWNRRSFGTGSQGHWSMSSAVYFTTTDPATQGFTPGGAPESGTLPSTTTEPSDLGLARLHRYAQGTWDSTSPTPTHTGSAGPQ